MARAKQQKARSICIHVHILLCLGINGGAHQNISTPAERRAEGAGGACSTTTAEDEEPESNSSSRKATIELRY